MKKGFRIFCMITTSLILLICSGTRTRAEEYQYDDLDRLVKVTYEDGSYTEYSYDANGNILEVNVYDANPRPSTTPNPAESSEASETPSESGASESSEPSETSEPDTNESSESSSESGDESETESQGNEEQQEESADDISIVEKVVAAIEEFFTKVINWFKKWF